MTVSAGATISATVTNGSGNPGDWLGVYTVGAATGTGKPSSWKWLSTDDARNSVPPAPGISAGTVHLVVPAQAGKYEVRFFPNNSFTVAATSVVITVGRGGGRERQREPGRWHAPPPPPVSPDGTTSTAPSGPALITSAAPGRGLSWPLDHPVNPNQPVRCAVGIGLLMEVAIVGSSMLAPLISVGIRGRITARR